MRATAFEALAYVGLDDESARVAIEGLESDDPPVRAMAAYALRGWQGPGDAAARLAPHLDDTWAVAVRAARTLQSMGPAGSAELQARVSRQDIGGLLARQMLWQPGAHALMSFWRDALIAFSLLITAYFVLWNVSQIAMSPLAESHAVAASAAAHPARPWPGRRRRRCRHSSRSSRPPTTRN